MYVHEKVARVGRLTLQAEADSWEGERGRIQRKIDRVKVKPQCTDTESLQKLKNYSHLNH
jgi:hypothetical protein